MVGSRAICFPAAPAWEVLLELSRRLLALTAITAITANVAIIAIIPIIATKAMSNVEPRCLLPTGVLARGEGDTRLDYSY